MTVKFFQEAQLLLEDKKSDYEHGRTVDNESVDRTAIKSTRTLGNIEGIKSILTIQPEFPEGEEQDDD